MSSEWKFHELDMSTELQPVFEAATKTNSGTQTPAEITYFLLYKIIAITCWLKDMVIRGGQS
jgi:hypothetical protein